MVSITRVKVRNLPGNVSKSLMKATDVGMNMVLVEEEEPDSTGAPPIRTIGDVGLYVLIGVAAGEDPSLCDCFH